MTRPAKKRAKTQKPRKTRRSSRKPTSSQPDAPPPDDLKPAQRTFALEYLGNGFNATGAYKKAYPKANQATAEVQGHRSLRLPKVRAFLNGHLENAWKPLQMGGEEALGRVALLASDDPDSRVRHAALRTILEQTGKLKTLPGSIDALADALRHDIETHKSANP